MINNYYAFKINFLILVQIDVQSKPLSTFEVLINQFLAMSTKKFLSTIRSWVLLAIQIIMPVVFLIIAIVVTRQQNRTGNLPAMPLTLNKFQNPVLVVDGNENGNYGGYAKIYKEVVGNAYRKVNNITETLLNLVRFNYNQNVNL